MKKRSIIFTAIILILGIVYLVIDSKLYHYGKSKFNVFNNSLPLGMNPDYWGTDVSFPIVGLTIKDQYGLVLIGKDSYFPQDGDTIMVERILKYGIHENKLIALIEARDKHNWFIQYQKNTMSQSKKELAFSILNSNTELSSDFEWINIEEDRSKISRLVMVRAYSMLILIVTCGICTQ
jgi:uncharacterized protein YpmB